MIRTHTTFALTFALLAGSLSGISSTARALPAQAARPKAWIDAKSMCIFPLGSQALPTTREELTSGLTEGYRKSLKLSHPERTVTAAGGQYPSMDTLRIDLSDAVVDMKRKAAKTKLTNKVESSLDVGQFEVVGEPLLMEKAKLNWSVTASDARLQLEHDRRGKPLVLLADARQGALRFEATKADLEGLMLAGARAAASKYGVTVVSTTLTLTSDGGRSVKADLHISTKVGFIPAGMRFKAHVDIDDSMNAKITHLTCDGDEALGPLISGIIQPALKDYEGKKRPLLSFPSEQLHLRDVQLVVDDSVHLTAAFGN